MQLVSFSIENYRSITTARKIALSDYSVLIGANNEGKSNILHALTLAMRALVDWHRNLRRTADGRIIRNSRTIRRGEFDLEHYDWKRDFPVSKQNKHPNDGTSNITLEFSLDDRETEDFATEIKSQVNGTLPIQVSFGARGYYDVSVKKQGRGHHTLNKKSTRVADFISRRIRFDYIPAIRTADSAERVISFLVERELARLEQNDEYVAALKTIENLQKPIFNELASTIQDTISGFLPDVQGVKLNARREAHHRALCRDVEVLVDDGNETALTRKGDGVQSLVALALMRHASEENELSSSTVIAIEEPESHLHPDAVHELRSVIESLSENNQIVLSSHSPLFIDPTDISNAIVVRGSRAMPAKHIAEIRETLGVRFSDNLQNASLVLLVEGSTDAKAVRALLSQNSENLKKAIQGGLLSIDHIGGASGLPQKASFFQSSACQVQCLLDNDAEAKKAVEKACKAKVLRASDINMCSVGSMPESEIEDLYDKAMYGQQFYQRFLVDPGQKLNNSKDEKFTKSMEKLFRHNGKPWSDDVASEIKSWLSDFAANNPYSILKEELKQPIFNFISSAETKLGY